MLSILYYLCTISVSISCCTLRNYIQQILYDKPQTLLLGTEYLCSPNLYVEALTPNVMKLGSVAFEKS